MDRLFLISGTMGAGKTAKLVCKYNRFVYDEHKKVTVLKSYLDIRHPENVIKSRSGLQCPCDSVIKPEHTIKKLLKEDTQIIIIDEVQFLTEEQIYELKDLSREYFIFCYGIMNDFVNKQFPSISTLLFLADNIKYYTIKCRTHNCNNKGHINARFFFDSNNKKIYYNKDNFQKSDDLFDTIDVGEPKYETVCYMCWKK